MRVLNSALRAIRRKCRILPKLLNTPPCVSFSFETEPEIHLVYLSGCVPLRVSDADRGRIAFPQPPDYA
jgi:hypothetical protein